MADEPLFRRLLPFGKRNLDGPIRGFSGLANFRWKASIRRSVRKYRRFISDRGSSPLHEQHEAFPRVTNVRRYTRTSVLRSAGTRYPLCTKTRVASGTRHKHTSRKMALLLVLWCWNTASRSVGPCADATLPMCLYMRWACGPWHFSASPGCFASFEPAHAWTYTPGRTCGHCMTMGLCLGTGAAPGARGVPACRIGMQVLAWLPAQRSKLFDSIF